MNTVCESTSIYSTTTMHDHRDHMDHINHIDHKDHMMSITPRIIGSSAGSVKTEIAIVMLLICLSKALI